MKKYLFTFCLLLMIGSNLYAQDPSSNVDNISETQIISESYRKGMISYREKNYLSAYKYLIIYKYTHFDTLNLRKNLSNLQTINQAIAHCENQLKSGNISTTLKGSPKIKAARDNMSADVNAKGAATSTADIKNSPAGGRPPGKTSTADKNSPSIPVPKKN